MSSAEEIEARHRERAAYIVAFYELTVDEPLRWATHRQIAAAANIPEERVMAISQHLHQEGLVQLRTMGGLDGSVELMPAGVRRAEEAIKQVEVTSPTAPDVRSDEEWADENMPLLQLAFAGFQHDCAWPEIDSLQRALDRSGHEIDVRTALVNMPRLPGESAPFYPTTLHIPLRLLRFVPEAAGVLELCLDLVKRAVELYYSDAEKLEITSDDSWTALLQDRNAALVAARLLLNDAPNPFAGGGYGAGSWSLSVNGTMVRRFQGIKSIDDYFSRQRQIRADDSRQFAALTQRSQAQPSTVEGETGPAHEAAKGVASDGETTVFVIMPFGEDWSAGVFDFIRRAIMSSRFAEARVVRADEITAPGKIDQQIVQVIRAADIVIADITGANPNVMWELGYAQALLTPAVVMNQRVGDSPFDLASTRQVSYRLAPTDDDQAKLASHIESAMDERRSVRP